MLLRPTNARKHVARLADIGVAFLEDEYVILAFDWPERLEQHFEESGINMMRRLDAAEHERVGRWMAKAPKARISKARTSKPPSIPSAEEVLAPRAARPGHDVVKQERKGMP